MMKFLNKQHLLALLLFSLLSSSAHTLIHSNDHHTHDTSCAVYVLEQLFVADDAVQTITIATRFTLFITPIYFSAQRAVIISSSYHERAPPFA